ncbi:MAG: DJ-1/PfpI family protein [Acidobacteriota bacterium]
MRPLCLALLLIAGLACAPEMPPIEDTPPPQLAPAADWTPLPTPMDLPADRPLRAGFLIVDGVYNTELTAPYDLLQHTIFHTRKPENGGLPGIEVFTVSPDGEKVTTFEGLRIEADYSFATAPPIDILVVPSAEHSMDSDLENEAMMAWVREVGGAARYLMSLCDGAFVLAAAGLLDDRAVTTFPADQDRFAEMFPELDLRREAIYVHDGPAITSQGGARSFDPALYLVAHLYGDEVAKGVGRGMVLPWPPEGSAEIATVVVPES